MLSDFFFVLNLSLKLKLVLRDHSVAKNKKSEFLM